LVVSGYPRACGSSAPMSPGVMGFVPATPVGRLWSADPCAGRAVSPGDVHDECRSGASRGRPRTREERGTSPRRCRRRSSWVCDVGSCGPAEAPATGCRGAEGVCGVRGACASRVSGADAAVGSPSAARSSSGARSHVSHGCAEQPRGRARSLSGADGYAINLRWLLIAGRERPPKIRTSYLDGPGRVRM
jgi:hypothetical protein